MNNLIKSLAISLLALPLALGAAQRPVTPFTDAELDQLLAPIALYPDTVLAHVLVAATVPDEVEEAADWSSRHPNLRGQDAVEAVDDEDWDPSVKALVAFPDLLDRMSDDPEWTDDLGQAFLDQESDVMDRVQVLRDRADEAGNLDSLEHTRVVREREYIYLEPAAAEVVYVPYYDPWYVYGTWWWGSYPPHCWTWWDGHPARYYYGHTYWWGVGFHVAPSIYVSHFDWHARRVVVSQPHRHYSPPPGYSGSSSTRVPREHHGSDLGRRPRRDNGLHQGWQRDHWRQDGGRQDRRDERVVREDRGRRLRGEPAQDRRRSWSDVRDELGARREARERDGARGRDASPGRSWQRQDGGRYADADRREPVVRERSGHFADRGPGDRIVGNGRPSRIEREERISGSERAPRVEREERVIERAERPQRSGGSGSEREFAPRQQGRGTIEQRDNAPQRPHGRIRQER